MLAIERREHILSFLRRHEYANVETLAENLAVSSMTIRRDLNKLEEQGLVRRTHGGATIGQYINTQPHTEERRSQSPDEKASIARYASSMVHDGHSILLDAGTTCMDIAQAIAEKNIRVITSDLAQAQFLCRYKNLEVFIPGGRVDDRTQSCLGSKADAFLDNVHVDIAFVGCTSWDLRRGVTTPTERRCSIKQKMIERAVTSILVADSDKYGRFSFHKICDLKRFDLVITDDRLDASSHEALSEAGVDVFCTQTSGSSLRQP
ncbi:DeoR/GlpR family DNA-binding transcription regulator [Sansalvadorimonas verongulae]|uniref:DeoR/GlpR family DNA-binding transcription regulator n=1 Tax=Sansalvadorimonas verongulae TaxID=2172824 RepID=UPI0018AD2027|nr:DeoR/GlpR family DNA-binding transcription regulator [Sansalvadorimonas verongulae]MTI13220.1 DeoR/GlpR transcriptional regulator [Sansalvadorimonas verongulae]